MSRKCPRCGNGLHPQDARNSRSRVDNRTLICSPCGTAESLFNHFWPNKPLPPLTEKIEVNV